MLKKAAFLSLSLASPVIAAEPIRDPAQIECFFYYMERASSRFVKGEGGINHWSYAAYELCHEISSRKHSNLPLTDNMKAAMQTLKDFEQAVYNWRNDQAGNWMGSYGPSAQEKQEMAEAVGLLAVLEAFEDGW